MSNETIICRCSDITLEEIRQLIQEGYRTVDEIKRISRAGMGPCQGRTCSQLILREIANYTGRSIAELEVSVSRPPVTGIKLKQIVSGGGAYD
ncbi:BFD-like [2Fe-2S] binding domain-containing protein [Proteiniborus ethanoligenes]|uniref:BFD-like [2Fe-2S] binding domain-containing protein n=1 Tax=Proteiniborus ethanoligenes TaxID=415015 RepID=A0A1H3N997_9FIRM|nr:(2Fe-2S)-binding protein [Proteiniborus ethanoligenes]TAH63554.1 MAG: (2Fe-2S)-binding protein [Gottschalkiaceae bacterium]SDY85313.1 BFD-like [2Fe-2S] binding domain-containing protein [Proteiniborus ethanoligenes]